MSTLRISIGIIDRDISQDQPVRLDAKHMHRRILDRDPGDSRRVEIMRVEEFRLRHAAVTALAVPPAGSVAIQDRRGLAFDGDVCARDGDERT